MPDKNLIDLANQVQGLLSLGKAAITKNAQTGTSYTVVDGDRGKLLTLLNASAVAVAIAQAGAGGNFLAGWFLWVTNLGVGTVTITPATSTIDGAATLVLATNQGAIIFSDGTNYFSVRGIATGGGTGTVTTTGSPASGNLTKFSGATSVTNADLSGDVTTAGGVATTVAKIQGTTVSGVTGTGNAVLSASPALTGTPTAPTAGGGTNTTQLATTAFVEQEIATATGVGGSANYFAWGGDGSDGSLHYDGAATILGMAPVANVYTLTRDIFASSITIDVGITVKTNNFAIFCTGTLTNAGTIHNNGNSANNGTNASSSSGGGGGGAVLGAGTSTGRYPRLASSIAGTTGGAGGTAAGTQAGAANVGTNASTAIDSSGSSGATGNAGGQGGTGTSGAGGASRGGGTGGTVSSIAAANGHNPIAAQNGGFLNTTTTAWNAYTSQNGGNGGAPGGSGGGGDTTNSGGGGGGGGSEGGLGGMMGIFAKTISNSGTISSNGATGGNGGNGFTPTLGNTGGGGGAAGGSGGKGGIIWLVYHVLTNSGTIQAVGGGGGTHGTKGSPHGTGTNNAADGADGPTGPNGIVIQIQA